MLKLFLGTDRDAARREMVVAVKKVSEDAEILRITDSNTVEDVQAALQGGGMFSRKRILVFEGVCTQIALCEVFLPALEYLSKSNEDTFVFEEKPLAEVRKRLEKFATTVEKFDAPKKERDNSIFVMANALRAGDRKALWVGYMREVAKGNAPEAVHGVLFWGAKDMFLKAMDANTKKRAAKLVAELAELPHAARRRGEDLEYALERFTLSGA